MTDWNDQTAEWYAAQYGEYPTNQAALVGLVFSPNMVVVDVGCGTGSALRSASEYFAGGKLIGIDPVNRMIEIARNKTHNHPSASRISFQKGSAENLPLVSSSSDFVFAFDSIDHWEDMKNGLREIHRILKPSGTLVIVKDLGVPGAANHLEDLRKMINPSGYDIHEDRKFSVEKIEFVRMICKKICG